MHWHTAALYTLDLAVLLWFLRGRDLGAPRYIAAITGFGAFVVIGEWGHTHPWWGIGAIVVLTGSVLYASSDPF